MPQYCDLQVNGAFGVDFNSDDLSAEQLHFAAHLLAHLGVTQFLPTLITDSLTKLELRLKRLLLARANSTLCQQMIPGFHVEGPFLSDVRGYVGAHPVEHTCDASIDAAQRIVEAGEGLVKLITLAPERDLQGKTTRWLVDRSIRVSAGHTDASIDQLKCCIDQGLSGFTHLGNATPPLLPRHDNIIQRALALRDHLTIMLIADGHHLPLFMLQNLLALLGTEKTVVVTDCISAAGLGPGHYHLAHQTVQVTEDLACRSADGSHFVGSAATMPMMDRILDQSLAMASASRDCLLLKNPMRFLGLIP